MSGEHYSVVMTPTCHRIYKKYDANFKEIIKKEISKLAYNPHSAKQLKKPLNEIRSYVFRYKSNEYRIAYKINENEKTIVILLIKTREKFYEILKRTLKV